MTLSDKSYSEKAEVGQTLEDIFELWRPDALSVFCFPGLPLPNHRAKEAVAIAETMTAATTDTLTSGRSAKECARKRSV